MKYRTAMLLAAAMFLTGCGQIEPSTSDKKGMEVKTEPETTTYRVEQPTMCRTVGIVYEVTDKHIGIYMEHGGDCAEISRIGLEEQAEFINSLKPGDWIAVIHDGNMAETYPLQIQNPERVELADAPIDVEPTTEPVTNTEPTEPTKPEPTEPDPGNNNIDLSELDNITDEKLIEIYKNRPAMPDDFYALDLFGTERDIDSEKLNIEFPERDYPSLQEYIDYTIDKWTDRSWSRKEDIENGGIYMQCSDVKKTFVGENDDYIEYLLTYTETTEQKDNSGAVITETSPVTERFVFTKRITVDAARYNYNGEMTTDAVKRTLDPLLNTGAIMRYTTEDDNYITYIAYGFDTSSSASGDDVYASIVRATAIIDKSDGSLSFNDDEYLHTCIIPD